MAALATRGDANPNPSEGTLKSEPEFWRNLPIQEWSAENLFVFVSDVMKLDTTACCLLNLNVSGTDLHAHFSKDKFNVDAFCLELELIASNRDRAIIQRKLEYAHACTSEK
jgi:hypothetical protein